MWLIYLFFLCLSQVVCTDDNYAKDYVYYNFTFLSLYHFNKIFNATSHDVDIHNVNLYRNKGGYKYFAGGPVVIYDSRKYMYAICGFSKDKSGYEKLDAYEYFVIDQSSVLTNINIYMGCNNDSINYFSCFACDEYSCAGMYLKFQSNFPTNLIVQIFASIAGITLVFCCCICVGIIENLFKKSDKVPIVTGIPVSDRNINLIPVSSASNQALYAMQNNDRSIELCNYSDFPNSNNTVQGIPLNTYAHYVPPPYTTTNRINNQPPV